MLEDPALPRPTTVTWLYCSAIEVSISVRQAPGIWLHCPPAHKSFLHTLWDSAVFSGLVKYDLLFIRFQASEKWVTLQNYHFHASLPNHLSLGGLCCKRWLSYKDYIITINTHFNLYLLTETIPFCWNKNFTLSMKVAKRLFSDLICSFSLVRTIWMLGSISRLRGASRLLLTEMLVIGGPK